MKSEKIDVLKTNGGKKIQLKQNTYLFNNKNMLKKN